MNLETRAVIVMGVSGSGKSTFGVALAERLGWTFADADDYHPEPNRQKMARGQALNDDDRKPWLERLHQLIAGHVLEHQPLVLACSALKASYREILTANLEHVEVVFLSGSRELIAERMNKREHFMPVSLLESQLATLEPPSNAIVVDIGKPIGILVNDVITRLNESRAIENGGLQ